MRAKLSSHKAPAKRVVKDVRRATRKQYSALLARKALERLGAPRATF